MKNFKFLSLLEFILLMTLLWPLMVHSTLDSKFSTGPLRAEDCQVLLESGMTIRPTYSCSECDSSNAMTGSVTLCWKCQKPHGTELPQDHFRRNIGGQVYVRAVDIVSASDLPITHVSRIQCSNCGASNPGLDIVTGEAPVRCANPNCRSDEFDSTGAPLPANLSVNGSLSRLVYSEGLAHLVVVPDSVAEGLDNDRFVSNAAIRLRAQLREEYLKRYGSEGMSVQELDRRILEGMRLNLRDTGFENVDIDGFFSFFERQLEMTSSVGDSELIQGQGQGQGQGPKVSSSSLSPPDVGEPIDTFSQVKGSRLSQWVSWVKQKKKEILAVALATTSISMGALAVYGFEHRVWGAKVDSIHGHRVNLVVLTGEGKTEKLSFDVPNFENMRIEVGDKVSVHGPRWFRINGYTGIGFESGDYIAPGR